MDRDVLLIKAVERFPQLYDKRNEMYKDNLACENAWRRVSSQVNATVEDCELRWKQLRQRFSKERAKISPFGSSTCTNTEWCLYKHLQFLQVVVKRRRTMATLAELPYYDIDSDGASQSQVPNIEHEETKSECSGTSSPIPSSSAERKQVAKDFKESTADHSNLTRIFSSSVDLLRIVVDNQQEREKADSIQYFVLHLAGELRKVQPKLINKCKIDMLKVVEEYINGK